MDNEVGETRSTSPLEMRLERTLRRPAASTTVLCGNTKHEDTHAQAAAADYADRGPHNAYK